MRIFILCCCLVAVIAKTAFANEVVTTNTRYGKITVTKDDDAMNTLQINGKKLYQADGGFLTVVKAYNLTGITAVLVDENAGGSGTPSSYFFITLKPGAASAISEYFDAGFNEIKPKQVGDKIVIDLGYKKGKREIATYQSGKITISRTPKIAAGTTNKVADEDDCNYLYNDIYGVYIEKHDCDSAPEDASGMSTYRAYNQLSNDPRLNMQKFQHIAKSSCKSWNKISYSSFKKQVCSGQK